MRFNRNKYYTDDDKKLIEKINFLFSKDIDIITKNNEINTVSSCKADFQKHFHKVIHKNNNLDEKYFTIIKNTINNRLNNSFEVFYISYLNEYKLTNDDLWNIIINCPEINSYIFFNNNFYIEIYDKKTNYSSILELNTKHICDGWAPFFNIDKGFYDDWYSKKKNSELVTLNKEYDKWKKDNKQKLFTSLIYNKN